MIKKFKEWMMEVQNVAIAEKKRLAREEGDESMWKNQIWRSQDKNKDIKQRFREEAEKKGYQVRPNSAKGEWLYDLVWQRVDEQENLTAIELVMEIEMAASREEIRYDFNKLLQSDAPYKVMVFQLLGNNEVLAAFDLLEGAATRYHAKSASEFLLCGWCISEQAFHFREFVLESGGAEHTLV